VLVISLCVCLPHTIGVPLSLLLVLSSVPVLNLSLTNIPTPTAITSTSLTPSTTSSVEEWIEHFKNAPRDDKSTVETPSSVNIMEAFALPKINEREIKDKLSLYEKVRSKQHAFEKQMEKINQNLKNVKEFYANNIKQADTL
jgi:hypothetical protein